MTIRKKILAVLAVLALLAAGVWAVRCRSSRPGLGEFDRAVISGLGKKSLTVTDPETIDRIAKLIRGLERDRGLYDTAKTTVIELYLGKKLRHTLSMGSNLFNLEGRQYRDTTGELTVLVYYMVDSGAALRMRIRARPERCPMGEDVEFLVTFKNVGGEKLRMPAAPGVEVSFLELTEEVGWLGNADNNFPVEPSPPETADRIEELAPGAERGYAFKFSSRQLEKGTLQIFLKFQPPAEGQDKGVVTPAMIRHIPLVVE